MDELLTQLKEKISDVADIELLINLNRRILEKKEHIRRYIRIRKLHSDILDSMINYIDDGNYNIDAQFISIGKFINRETKNSRFVYNSNDAGDNSILTELFVYKNHPKIKSITDIYLEKRHFRNETKVRLLRSMKNSVVGLFKIIAVDSDNGYITCEDVFTHKKYKVIDIALSSTTKIDKYMTIYLYNRIITFDNISYFSGIHCLMTSKNKELMEFIKKHKYKSCSDFGRCLILYDISKREKNLKIHYNDNC